MMFEDIFLRVYAFRKEETHNIKWEKKKGKKRRGFQERKGKN